MLEMDKYSHISMRRSSHRREMLDVASKKRCPECRAVLIDDTQNGEIICTGCGIVIAEQLEDHGPEGGYHSFEESTKLTRASGTASYAQHDLGIATSIPETRTDYNGKKITTKVANKMDTIRLWQNRIRVTSPRERRLASILSCINKICSSLRLPENVHVTSSMIYRDLNNRIDVKGKSVVSISIAVIYIACKQCYVVKSVEDITRGACTPGEVRTKSKLAAKYYRSIVMETNIMTPVLTIDKYISRLANLTNTDVRVQRLALSIAEKTKSRMIDGKGPNGVAAAYLYIASILMGFNMRQRYISNASGVTEVTIRNRCRDILSDCRINITLRPVQRRR